MKKYINLFIWFLILILPMRALALDCSLNAVSPAFLSNGVLPSTTFIFDNSGSMNSLAYNATFAPTYPYYGIFDSYSYYSYNSTGDYFYKNFATGPWSGNFLNWFMRRMDVAKKVMVGGEWVGGYVRVVDTDRDWNRGAYNDNATVVDINGQTRYMTEQYLGAYRNWTSIDGSNDSNTMRYTFTCGAGNIVRYLRILAPVEPTGILQKYQDRMRLAIFTFDNEDNNGADIQFYMQDNISATAAAIRNNINLINASTWTPLGEAFHTVTGYVRQVTTNVNGPRYGSDAYDLHSATTPDPFWFNSTSSLVECSKQNVIIVTDGESTQDLSIPVGLRNYAGAGFVSYASSGSNYLQDVALWAHTTDLRPTLDGNQTIDLYGIFAFGSGTAGDLLKNATMFGGFTDANGDNRPTFTDTNGNGRYDSGDTTVEFDTDNNGVPDGFFQAESGSELEAALDDTLNLILSRMSAGSAASVISASRSGAGALYQAIFWPEVNDVNANRITWGGDVHAFLTDRLGNLYLDNQPPGPPSGNHQLDLSGTPDSRVILYYNVGSRATLACINGAVTNGTCNGTVESNLSSLDYLWTASDWLNGLPDANLISTAQTYGSDSNRYLFTWWDTNIDGTIDSGEVIDFTVAPATTALLADVLNATVINWVRGVDQSGMRSRYILSGGLGVTWRLGDIIHSTPTVVGTPAENYDLYWGDETYSAFYRKYKNRRIMLYFGGNDGIIHALNGGFYHPEQKRFYNDFTPGSPPTWSDDNSQPDLGAEMWGYIPYNLLPNLRCLTNLDYQHQYFVDLQPRIFDAKIFTPDTDHPEGWGTVMVTGMRLGGCPTVNGTTTCRETTSTGDRYFGSSYIIMDITNPESPPVLLGEITYNTNSTAGSVELGYTTATPGVVPIRDKDDETPNNWFLLLGSGPQNLSGNSLQRPQILVIPMGQLVGGSNQANPSFSLRVSETATPTATVAGVRQLTYTNSTKSYVGSGFVSVDRDFDLQTELVFFGTVDTVASPVGGRLCRIETGELSTPIDWNSSCTTSLASRPVTGLPNFSLDETKRMWDYFGTGRFLISADKTDTTTQRFYGLIDPLNTGAALSTYTDAQLFDVTDVVVQTGGNLVCAPTNATSSPCLNSLNTALAQAPGTAVSLFQLREYIRNNLRGWYMRFNNPSGERVIGQSSILGGLLNFTTYIPVENLCAAEGTSNLYALYYLTGSAWHRNVFAGANTFEVQSKMSLGQGMSTTPSMFVGGNAGSKVFVQTSTGEIIEIEQSSTPIDNIHSGKMGWHIH